MKSLKLQRIENTPIKTTHSLGRPRLRQKSRASSSTAKIEIFLGFYHEPALYRNSYFLNEE